MTEREQVPLHDGDRIPDDTLVDPTRSRREHSAPAVAPVGGPLPPAPPGYSPTPTVYEAPLAGYDPAPAGYQPVAGGYDTTVPDYSTASSTPPYPAAAPEWPAEAAEHDFPDESWEGVETEPPPAYPSPPVALRRSETAGSLLLLLAGICAGLSLLLPWVHGSGATGAALVRHGLTDLRAGAGALLASGYWQPLAVVLGGGLLFLVGLLLVVPARTHRLLGAVALLVALVAGAGVLVPLSAAGWNVHRFAVGMWFAVAVAGLGLLGALKALFTGPRYGRDLPSA